jgi:Lrp/AsnC family transcriptional regulator for asnA, asnC and gidA
MPKRATNSATRSRTPSARNDSAADSGEASPFEIDPLDRRIISALQEQARVSNADLARRFRVGEATVRRRIDRLLSSGAIRIVAVPSPEIIGYSISALIGLSCEPRFLEAVGDAISDLPETRYLAYSTGSFDVIFEAFFRSQKDLFEFLTAKLGAVPGITRSETAVMLHVRQFSFEWEIPLEP